MPKVLVNSSRENGRPSSCPRRTQDSKCASPESTRTPSTSKIAPYPPAVRAAGVPHSRRLRPGTASGNHGDLRPPPADPLSTFRDHCRQASHPPPARPRRHLSSPSSNWVAPSLSSVVKGLASLAPAPEGAHQPCSDALLDHPAQLAQIRLPGLLARLEPPTGGHAQHQRGGPGDGPPRAPSRGGHPAAPAPGTRYAPGRPRRRWPSPPPPARGSSCDRGCGPARAPTPPGFPSGG